MSKCTHTCMNCGHHMKEEDSDTKAFCVFWMDYHVKDHTCRNWTDDMYLEEILLERTRKEAIMPNDGNEYWMELT